MRRTCRARSAIHFRGAARSITWLSLQEAAQQTAKRLAGLGVSSEDSVALMLPNGPAAVEALFGALYGGFRLTEINLAAGADAIGYALSHSGAKVVICGEGQAELLTEALALHDCDLRIIEAANEHIDWPETPPEAKLPKAPSAATQGLLMYTSGTTGRPKGVVPTHASLLAGGWTTAMAHALTPKDVALCVLPHYHINGLCVTVIAPLVSGGGVAMAERFSASRFWGRGLRKRGDLVFGGSDNHIASIAGRRAGKADDDANSVRPLRLGALVAGCA